MTSTRDFYLLDYTTEIICLNTFPEFLGFIHMTSKLSIFSNYAKHPKGLTLYYTPLFFTTTYYSSYLKRKVQVRLKLKLELGLEMLILNLLQ